MHSQRKYYEAYDDRYRQVHQENLRWFAEKPSAIVLDVIKNFAINKSARLLEIGCGEGRDARFLLEQGYNLTATDVSEASILFCRSVLPEYAKHFRVLDCVTQRTEGEFAFIYAVAVLHMLVRDEDRRGFYQFIADQLSADGIALICTMGDGELERQTDISTAFDLQERVHEQTGRTVWIAGTSYRAVSFETFQRELAENGLKIIKQGLTDMQPDYWKMMYAIVRKS